MDVMSHSPTIDGFASFADMNTTTMMAFEPINVHEQEEMVSNMAHVHECTRDRYLSLPPNKHAHSEFWPVVHRAQTEGTGDYRGS
jgi:hypothetical protein